MRTTVCSIAVRKTTGKTSRRAIVPVHLALMRPPLGDSVLPGTPQYCRDINRLEQVQQRDHSDGPEAGAQDTGGELGELGLASLERRGLRGI